MTLTQAEYNQLDPPDPDTTYIISDAGPIDMNTYLGGLKFWTGTSSEYSSITPKDPMTLYIIVDSE